MNKNIAQKGFTAITDDVRMANCVFSTKESVFLVEQARKNDHLSLLGLSPNLIWPDAILILVIEFESCDQIEIKAAN